MSDRPVPAPTVMPGDRETWRKQLDQSNFINTYYQVRDVRRCGEVKTILIVGPGQGLDTAVLRWLGYEVTTLDIDETFHPDVIASVHTMDMFRDRQFDVIIASHVLEHMAVPYLDSALRELARVGRFVLLYLPVHGRHMQFRVKPGFKDLDLALNVDVFNYFSSADGMTPRYMAGHHFWEIGLRGFRVRDIVKRVSQFFDVIDVYRNKDWLKSQNFILRSKGTAP